MGKTKRLYYNISVYGQTREEILKDINDAFDDVPEEYRESARGDELSEGDLTITYTVPYTPEELVQQKKEAVELKKYRINRLKSQLKELQG